MRSRALLCLVAIAGLLLPSLVVAQPSQRSVLVLDQSSAFLPFNAAVANGYIALAVAGILGTVIGAYYYLRIVKVMYMDEPAEPYARPREPIQGLLIIIAALIVSPFGYLLIGPLGTYTDKAAGTLF